VPNPQYVSYPFILTSKGLNSRNTIDRIPDHQYYNLDNAELRQENSLASRLGRAPITYVALTHSVVPLPDTDVHNLARLQSLLAFPYRYAGAGANLYRHAGTVLGAYTAINGPFVFSGGLWSSANYRPTNSSVPYIFFADADVMVKDNGTFNPVEMWGIFPPTAPPTLTLGPPTYTVVNDFSTTSGYAVGGFGTITSAGLVNTTLGTAITTAPGSFTVTPASMTNIIQGSLLNGGSEDDIFVTSVSPSTFNDNHATSDAVVNNGISTTSSDLTPNITANATFTPTEAIQLNGDNGQFNIGIQLSDFTKLTQLQITFHIPSGAFYQATLSATTSPAIPTTNAYQEIVIPVSAFTPMNGAGGTGQGWGSVSYWVMQFTFTATSQTVSLGNFSYSGGVGPTVIGTGAVPYDYRITFYNMNTGDESGPSVVMIPTSYVSPVGQPVIVNFADAVTPPPPLDPQVTDIRIYRRGGTLPNQWLQVGQVPIGTTTFTDTMTDEQIATNNILDVDTAPPVTSTLPVPVNTTLSANTSTGEYTVAVGSTANMYVDQMLTIDPLTSSEETVIIQAISGSNITAYFQYIHLSGAIVQASTRAGQPCNIAAIAFNRAWIAGDPNNPDILYYSDVFNPESFPVENFIEVGTPSDPIMAVMEWNGQLYVFTQNTVWNILGAQEGSTAPYPFKTAAKHGLQAQFGWCIAEGEIYYQSFGGIYAFQGSDSRYASADIEWVFTAQFIDDDIQRVVPLMAPSQINQTALAYYQNEIYVSYIAQDGNRHRVIWDKVHQRWRNDDVPANCLLVEDDIYTLLYGTATTGMIYQDRISNADAGGLGGTDPFTFNVQTAALDLGMPKNFKNFNEFTIDIDTGGLAVTINLLFDYGLTLVPLGTVTTTTGRGQFEFNINNGDGQLSLNVSVQLTATIAAVLASPIEVYEIHIRATPEAELRQSFDSYLMDFGSPDYKFVKQGWFEYMALDPGGIVFNCYRDGGNTLAFTFTLPQSLTRTSKRVRFPATKARNWRWVATSTSPFRLYSDSRFEWKMVTQDKGYQLRPLQQEAPQQP
jgi:hypothetical protein